MEDDELLTLITSELSDADQNLDFETPLDYYLGNPRGDEVPGRSASISTDVADAIEWIMPQIMKSFTQNNEIVIFDPVIPEDELQAELESQYVYEILMKENDGFIILHQFIKDALLQNNGFIKVYYSNDESIDINHYTGLTEQQIQSVLANPNAEILSSEAKDEIIPPPPTQGPPQQLQQPPQPQVIRLYDAKIAISTNNGSIIIESVAPEDFRVNSDHNSINLESARFTAHLLTKTISELREEGIPEDIIEKIESESDYNDDSDYRFWAQGEQTMERSDSPEDESLKEIHIAECYMHADRNGDGIAEFLKVTVGGQSNPSTIIDEEEIYCSPWVSTTAILMSHKWRGLSIYDRLKQIQDDKTKLMRNTLDNVTLQNNQRHLVLEGQANMDDLLTSRPGGVIRVKNPNAVTPLVTPQTTQDTFSVLQYLDEIRAGRSGVSPEGELKQHDIGERVGSQGLNRLMNAKEELVGLIIRLVAETGIKPLCYKIRNLCTKHIDAVHDFKFRGQWFKIRPSEWGNRVKSTVRVGTGTGNHQQQLTFLGLVIEKQSQILQIPGQALVTPQNQFKAYDDFCKFAGLNSAVDYFVDPNSPQGKQLAQKVQQANQQQQAQQSQLIIEQLKIQKQLAQAETEKANISRLNAELKSQAERARIELQHQKQNSDNVINGLKQKLDEADTRGKYVMDSERLDLERDRLVVDAGLKITELELKSKEQHDKQIAENAKTAREINKQDAA